MPSYGELQHYLATQVDHGLIAKRTQDVILELAKATHEITNYLGALTTIADPDLCLSQAHNQFASAISTADTHLIVGDVALARALPTQKQGLILQALTNHTQLPVNHPVGSIFSIMDMDPSIPLPLMPNGRRQRAAGVVLYGSRTLLALTTGHGTQVYTLDTKRGQYRPLSAPPNIPARAARCAINPSFQHRWIPGISDYVQQAMTRGQSNLHLHWKNSLVAETIQILLTGGLCIYPSEAPTYDTLGSVRLVEEAYPIAWLIEQAGGSATNGFDTILDIVPRDQRSRTAFVFGAKQAVAQVDKYCQSPRTTASSPLFGRRGIFHTAKTLE